ncbi:MAG: CdaR family protein [Caldilineaceae bacterium]
MRDLQLPKGWAVALSRLGSLLVSIIFAFAIWLYVNNLENPIVTRELSQRIQVTVRGLQSDLQPIQDLANQSVRVSVKAPLTVWQDLTVEDFSAYIDLTGMGIGSHTVPIVVDSTNPQAEIVDIQQPELMVQLDQLATKEMPIQVELLDRVALGFEAKTPNVDPISVTVAGPKTQVDLVTNIVASMYVHNAKSQVESTQPLTAINRQHRVVTGVMLDPMVADIVIPIDPQRGLKTVAVRLNLVGQPAYGYRLSTVKVEPSTVIVQGDPQVIDAVPGFIETEPIDLTNVSSEINKQIVLMPPSGTTVADGGAVNVRISIAPLEDSRTIRAQLLEKNLGKDYEVTKALDSVDVIISGPLTLVDGVNSDDVFAMLDMAGLLPGTHTIEPDVVLPEGIRSEGVLPETVEVTIVDKSTPAATIVPTDTVALPEVPITATESITTAE